MSHTSGTIASHKPRRRFAGNWIPGAVDTPSQRRRLMAVLRMAHRVLGVRRKGLGLGTLGGGSGSVAVSSASSTGVIGSLAVIIAFGSIAPAHAQYAAGGGSATGGDAVAIGANATASAVRGTAVGSGATASGASGSTAIGVSAQAVFTRECPSFCVFVMWSMLPERSKADDDFERIAGRAAEGLQAA